MTYYGTVCYTYLVGLGEAGRGGGWGLEYVTPGHMDPPMIGISMCLFIYLFIWRGGGYFISGEADAELKRKWIRFWVRAHPCVVTWVNGGGAILANNVDQRSPSHR